MFYSPKIFFKAASDSSILIVAVKIAAIVGVILNLINQGNIIINLDLAKINITKLIFTFFVPFGVSVYSSVMMKLNMKTGEKAKITARVKCITCGDNSVEIKKDELIDNCQNCKEETKYKVIEIIN